MESGSGFPAHTEVTSAAFAAFERKPRYLPKNLFQLQSKAGEGGEQTDLHPGPREADGAEGHVVYRLTSREMCAFLTNVWPIHAISGRTSLFLPNEWISIPVSVWE